MREFVFVFGGGRWIVSEGPDRCINGELVTEWEVRELCEDEFGHEYYQQYRSAYIPVSASESQIRSHIAKHYAD